MSGLRGKWAAWFMKFLEEFSRPYCWHYVNGPGAGRAPAGKPHLKATRTWGQWRSTAAQVSVSWWHEEVWAQWFSDRFILLWEKDLSLVLLNNCADKWQLHSITFQWEHYSRNIENGETFSCAFQIWDDIWNEQTLWSPVLRRKANEIQFQRGVRRGSRFHFIFQY